MISSIRSARMMKKRETLFFLNSFWASLISRYVHIIVLRPSIVSTKLTGITLFRYNQAFLLSLICLITLWRSQPVFQLIKLAFQTNKENNNNNNNNNNDNSDNTNNNNDNDGSVTLQLDTLLRNGSTLHWQIFHNFVLLLEDLPFGILLVLMVIFPWRLILLRTQLSKVQLSMRKLHIDIDSVSYLPHFFSTSYYQMQPKDGKELYWMKRYAIAIHFFYSFVDVLVVLLSLIVFPTWRGRTLYSKLTTKSSESIPEGI